MSERKLTDAEIGLAVEKMVAAYHVVFDYTETCDLWMVDAGDGRTRLEWRKRESHPIPPTA